MKAIPVTAPDIQAPSNAAPDNEAPTKPRKPRKARGTARKGARGKVAKPRKAAQKDQFGFRIGSLKNLAAKMCTTGRGATLAEIKDELGSPQYNFLITVENKGFKIETSQVKGALGRMVTRYKIIK